MDLSLGMFVFLYSVTISNIVCIILQYVRTYVMSVNCFICLSNAVLKLCTERYDRTIAINVWILYTLVEQQQRLAADERRREYHEEQRNEFENYAEEEHNGEYINL